MTKLLMGIDPGKSGGVVAFVDHNDLGLVLNTLNPWKDLDTINHVVSMCKDYGHCEANRKCTRISLMEEVVRLNLVTMQSVEGLLTLMEYHLLKLCHISGCLFMAKCQKTKLKGNNT